MAPDPAAGDGQPDTGSPQEAAAPGQHAGGRAHRTGSFYGWLWRRLPGTWPVKAATLLVGFAAVVVLLFGAVFPWLEPKLPFNQVTVGR